MNTITAVKKQTKRKTERKISFMHLFFYNLYRTRKYEMFQVLVFLIILTLSFSTGYCSYIDSYTGNGLDIRTEGLTIKRAEGDMVVAYLVQPNARMEISSLSSVPRNIRVKVNNICGKRYNVTSDSITPLYTSTRHLEFITNTDGNKTSVITISPRLDNPEKFTFAVLGDSRHGTRIHQKILRQIAGTNAIFAINLGDIVNDGHKWEYENYIKEISDFPLPYFVAIGNHEIIARDGKRLFVEYVNPLYYFFRMGRYTFNILDNANGRITDDQFAMLERNLKNNPNNFTFMHQPAFSPWEIHKNHIMHKGDAEYFMKLAEQHKIRIVFAAHIHGYAEAKRNGVQYFISGCAGASPYVLPSQGGFYHYMLINVDGDKVTTEVFRVDP
jgi:3',5'-cyclic-AMP phosphodiesterase